MPFSASTCLTYPQGFLSTGAFNIYSNVDNYTTPFQVSIPLLTLTTCPYIMGNVPDNTTSIKIIDTGNKCCATIDLLSNDLCTTCELGFDDYETNTVGVIVAGELTGSCQNTISDYRILWYGPDNSNQLAFTSGFGTDPDFLPRDFTHPLTGINSPMQPSGTYVPVIDKIKLNGLDFSQTGGTGYVQAELECFNATTVNLQPFTCDNGTEVGNYTHRVNFAGASAGVSPLTLQSTFNLDITTDYFAWKFKGETIPDSLKITFYGSAYSEPIILEYWVIGEENSNNVKLTTFPKLARTNQYVSKVTSLNQLNRNVGDYLILEVTPNPNNTQTNWDFYFTCLDSFDCSLGCLDNYLNTPYKIKTTSITNVPVAGTCGNRDISYDISGCTLNQFNILDISKYMVTSFVNIQIQPQRISTDNTTSLLNTKKQYWSGQTRCSISGSGNQPVCKSPLDTNTIKFEKTVISGIGVINMVFSDLNDLIVYKSSYENTKTLSGWVNDPTDFNYYKYARLFIPNSTGNEGCGDGITSLTFSIHFSSTITTGQTTNEYTLTMPMPTITNQLPIFTNCELDCNSTITSFVSSLNNLSTSTGNNTIKITNTGSRYTNPFTSWTTFTYGISGTEYSGYTTGELIINNSLNSTVPFSGNSSPYVQIPSLSAQTCNFSSIGQTTGLNTELQEQRICFYDYVLVMTNPPDLTSFQIKANQIVNGAKTTSNYPITAVTVVNGVVTSFNPSYAF
jgi:hypothetical protein